MDTLISDMSEMNDLPLIDVNPVYGFSKGPGYVTWGNDSRGWNFMLPWFVQFEGEGNAASNTRTQIRNLTTFIKSRSSGQWTQVIDSDSYEGIECEQGGDYYHCPQQAEVRIDEAQGAASSSPLPGLNLHAWWGSRVPIDGSDIAAVVVSLQARLIVDSTSGVDDRSDAKYLIHIGAEYYPADASPVNNNLGPIGVSRSKLVTSEWQTFALTTLNDVGMQEPGGGISSDELRADPPPLD